MSFKVICIGEWDLPHGYEYPVPIYGDKYTVVHEEMDNGMLMYELAEFPRIGRYRFTFEADAFAPLDGPSEVAIAEARIAEDAAELDCEWARIVHEYENA